MRQPSRAVPGSRTLGEGVGMTGDAVEGEERLPGGHLGGAVRVGGTVRRPAGPWTPAVHALLAHLAPRLPGVPRVLGLDDRGRPVLGGLHHIYERAA